VYFEEIKVKRYASENLYLDVKRATVGGSLMIKHEHREFPSDMIVLLEAVDALLEICKSMHCNQKALLD
jgi:hypothetical protein